MIKRVFFISMLIIFIGLFFCWEIRAQRSADPNEIMASLSERFNQMEAKMDKFSASLDKAGNRDVLIKLDQVLANQQKILGELEIVKVRASQKR
ncbi:MAG: hypothetical protein ABH882_01015 [Candidatus Omnitrophota bacterium]|nr:hypothetical protein [Candidatus Omnitrophota bacterium]MBU1929753.1 hypothetical protein [Candidatus Omnitrophota bacterium]MBU2035151.1 hypothetical protein [Candidatus Omnitrophota bacterium]MBU2222061.1 hypothetical protein [Candidatus Omnitrophota bacterium]MBU2257548.1 hypothetical protein [Candidatus Omnitrophota bacterium]